MRQVRRFTSFSVGDDRTETFWVQTGTQPALQAAWSRAVEAVSWSPLNTVLERLEPLVERWHDRHCADDCGEATRVPTGERTSACVRVPLDVWLDLYADTVRHRGWCETANWQVSEHVYNALDRVQRS